MHPDISTSVSQFFSSSDVNEAASAICGYICMCICIRISVAFASTFNFQVLLHSPQAHSSTVSHSNHRHPGSQSAKVEKSSKPQNLKTSKPQNSKTAKQQNSRRLHGARRQRFFTSSTHFQAHCSNWVLRHNKLCVTMVK